MCCHCTYKEQQSASGIGYGTAANKDDDQALVHDLQQWFTPTQPADRKGVELCNHIHNTGVIRINGLMMVYCIINSSQQRQQPSYTVVHHAETCLIYTFSLDGRWEANLWLLPYSPDTFKLSVANVLGHNLDVQMCRSLHVPLNLLLPSLNNNPQPGSLPFLPSPSRELNCMQAPLEMLAVQEQLQQQHEQNESPTTPDALPATPSDPVNAFGKDSNSHPPTSIPRLTVGIDGIDTRTCLLDTWSNVTLINRHIFRTIAVKKGILPAITAQAKHPTSISDHSLSVYGAVQFTIKIDNKQVTMHLSLLMALLNLVALDSKEPRYNSRRGSARRCAPSLARSATGPREAVSTPSWKHN